MSWYSATVFVHVALGTLALATFWIAAAARKGSPLHRGAGKAYLLAMAGLLVPAVPLTLRVLGSAQWAFGVFLAYLFVIVATSIWLSWRAIRDKRDFARYSGFIYRALAWLNLAGGGGILLFGALRAQPVFIAFALVGLLGGRQMLRLARRGPAHPRWWLEEHLSAMIANGVATHIAFLLIGLPRLLPEVRGPVLFYTAWLAPLGLALLARHLLMRKYFPVSGAAKAATQARGAAA